MSSKRYMDQVCKYYSFADAKRDSDRALALYRARVRARAGALTTISIVLSFWVLWHSAVIA